MKLAARQAEALRKGRFWATSACRWPRSGVRLVRPLFWLITLCLGIGLAWDSWMKWFDLLIDSGPQVYVPWRIVEGEHIGRDLVHPYGPLSSYFNAALFAVFGVGIRTLVLANLVIYAAITFLGFQLLRTGFGFFAAAMATLFGVAVFGFGHHVYAANYTFAFPYSHEATHGMLLLLALLAWLSGKGDRHHLGGGFGAGAIVGLLWLTKTEYVFSSTIVLALAFLRAGQAGGDRTRWAAGVFAGAAAVLALAWMSLALATAPDTALKTVTGAILGPVYYSAYARSAHVLSFLGADKPLENGLQLLRWSGGAVGGLTLLVMVSRRLKSAAGLFAIVGTLAITIAVLAWQRSGWLVFGFALPGLLLGGLALCIHEARTAPAAPGFSGTRRTWLRLLFLGAAAGMLARMALAPKVYHYGFFQAYLASLWVTAMLCAKWPPRFVPTRTSALAVASLSLAALGATAASAVHNSAEWYRQRTASIGLGADRVFSYRPDFFPFSDTWEQARELVLSTTAKDDTLLVVPEGLTLNYWTRRKHPLPITNLLPDTLLLSPNDVLATLKAAPPTVIVFVTRIGFHEHGHATYGATDASGGRILQWVRQEYELIASAGDPPFEPGKYGAQLWRRRS